MQKLKAVLRTVHPLQPMDVIILIGAVLLSATNESVERWQVPILVFFLFGVMFWLRRYGEKAKRQRLHRSSRAD